MMFYGGGLHWVLTITGAIHLTGLDQSALFNVETSLSGVVNQPSDRQIKPGAFKIVMNTADIQHAGTYILGLELHDR